LHPADNSFNPLLEKIRNYEFVVKRISGGFAGSLGQLRALKA